MSESAWTAPDDGGGPLPWGWTDEAIAAVNRMAEQLAIPRDELWALWYSESGLQPRIVGGGGAAHGLAQLTAVVGREMGWRPGTITQMVQGPIVDQLQGIFAFYAHLQEAYAGGSILRRAQAWGVSPAVVLYALQGFPAAATRATGPGSTLADAKTNAGNTYSGNAGLDIGSKGRITVADLATRIARKRAEMLADPKARRIPERSAFIATLPAPDRPTLASIFGRIRQAWQTLSGTPVRTSVGPEAAEAAAAAEAGAASSGNGPGMGGTILALAAVAGLAWLAWRNRA